MPHFERLEQLAKHLESGHLGHEEFAFTVYHESKGPLCGFRGCAIGECPTIWPDDWCFDDDDMPILRNPTRRARSFNLTVDHGCEWFELNREDFTSLFIPTKYIRANWNHAPLGGNSTKQQVAEGIRHYVQYMKAWKGANDAERLD